MPELLKNIFFTKSFAEKLANDIKSIHKEFDIETMLLPVNRDNWKNIELKEKMRILTNSLNNSLKLPYTESLQILLEIAPNYSGFDAILFPGFVECYGLEYPDISLPALKVFTVLCTSEFAIRPFIIKYPEKTLALMNEWAKDKDWKVRRLASEGCRPRLPWGMALPRLIKDPAPVIPILKKLKDDVSEDVRRSVANNLNDISKDNPEVVIDLCEKWYGKNEETNRLIKHACRTMLKKGNSRAMQLFGFNNSENITISGLKCIPKEPSIGESVEIEFKMEIKADTEIKVRLEYIVYYKSKSDKSAKKVFQIKEGNFKKGVHSISKKHSFAENSTRKHYPGEHSLAIIVNGAEKNRVSFNLDHA